MAIGKTTEKALAKVIELVKGGENIYIDHQNRKSGDVRIKIYLDDYLDEMDLTKPVLAQFSLSQIIGKRYAKRKKKAVK